MFAKIAIAASLAAAAGTTAYVVHDGGSTQRPVALAKLDTPTPTVKAPVAPAPRLAPAVPAPKLAVDDDGVPPGGIRVPPPDTEASISREQIAKLGLEKGASKGPANAPVTITVFTDMKCHFCSAALGSLDTLQEQYPDKVRIVVKQMPVHDSAKLAAEAAFAADAQGKFWELHDLMLANQDSLSRDGLLDLAQQAKLDIGKFRVALDKHTYADDVQADVKAAKEIEIMGTPAFVINGRKIIGNVPVENLKAAVESALAD